MNTEHIQILRDKLAALPSQRFSMATHGTIASDLTQPNVMGIELDENCGTAGCICGWAIATFRPDLRTSREDDAAAVLDLNVLQADRLFYARDRDRDRYPLLEDIPVAAAVKVLDRALTDGVISWAGV